MNDQTAQECRHIIPARAFAGKQGLNYFEGIAAENVGARAICMHILRMPPGARAKAHQHDGHETAIYMVSGEVHTRYGDRLQHEVIVRAGEIFYIPAGMPHLPENRSSAESVAVIARTDPREQESVTLLPHLDPMT
ncbi:MAG: cupin domain-containing protein [Rhizobium sp.]|nr:MAG: cupin domain-containing protein [Rhizobium sp.]